MGNDTVYVQFNPENRIFWASRSGLPLLDDIELDAAYQRAYKTLTEKITLLIKEHRWRDLEYGYKHMLLSFSKDGYINRFSLPLTFYSFVNPTKFGDWRMQFETGVFEGQKSPSSENDLFISGPAPLADIFYILQCISPGMLVLACRKDETDDMGEMEWIRAFPGEAWVTENEQILQHILGSCEKYEALLEICQDKEKAFAVTWINQWNDEDDSDCRSTGSTIVDDDGNETRAKYEWAKLNAIDEVTCGLECRGCMQCYH